VLACGATSKAPLQRTLALVGALGGFLVTIPLWPASAGHAGMQFVESAAWIPRFNVTTTSAWTASRCCSSAEFVHHAAGGDRRLDGDREARRPVHGRLPAHVGAC
jgi:hypothetical protein